MTDEANSIPWEPLGRDWWTDTGTRLGASEQQIAFAACMHAGTMSQKQAAILSGYASDTDRKAIQAGSSAAATRQVQNLFVMARGEMKTRELPETTVAPFSHAEWTQRLEEIASGPDAKLAMAAGSMLFDGKPQPTEIGAFAALDDGFNDWRLVRDYLRMAGGAVAIASIYAGLGSELAAMPLLHDVIDLLRRDDPEFLDRIRRRESKIGLATLDQHLADPRWQRDARQKIWLEVGVDIEAIGSVANVKGGPDGQSVKAPAAPGGATTQHTAVASIEARSLNGVENGRARGVVGT